MSDVRTVQDLLDQFKDVDPTSPLRFDVAVEHGRSVTGDSDSDWYVNEEDDEVVLVVRGDESSDTGWWE